MIPETLSAETENLEQAGYEIETLEEGNFVILIIQNFPLPTGYSKSATDVLLKLTNSYPNGKPDMFWVEEDVLLVNGEVPNKANVIETHAGRKWRRFSWHSRNWNPGRDDLNTFISFIEVGLLKAKEK